MSTNLQSQRVDLVRANSRRKISKSVVFRVSNFVCRVSLKDATISINKISRFGDGVAIPWTESESEKCPPIRSEFESEEMAPIRSEFESESDSSNVLFSADITLLLLSVSLFIRLWSTLILGKLHCGVTGRLQWRHHHGRCHVRAVGKIRCQEGLQVCVN